MLLVFLKTKEFMVQLQTSITFYYDYLLKKIRFDNNHLQNRKKKLEKII